MWLVFWICATRIPRCACVCVCTCVCVCLQYIRKACFCVCAAVCIICNCLFVFTYTVSALIVVCVHVCVCMPKCVCVCSLVFLSLQALRFLSDNGFPTTPKLSWNLIYLNASKAKDISPVMCPDLTNLAQQVSHKGYRQ